MEISVRKSGPGQGIVRTENAPKKNTTVQQTPKKDMVAWSREAIDYIQRSQKEALERVRKKQSQEKDPLISEYETKKKQMESTQKKLRTQRLCEKIAASIRRGDRVPPEDLAYLAQHDIDGYRMAMAMRKPKRNPEEVKSVLTDEDKRTESTRQDNSEEAASGTESSASAEISATDAGNAGGDMA